MKTEPCVGLSAERVGEGIDIASLLVACGLTASKSEARRLIQQGGIALNGQKVESADILISDADFEQGALILRKGKKIYHKVYLSV
jgi:tyrosyl-tRNA synthetase